MEGRTALVTGATSGIGFAIAQKLAYAGMHVIVHGRRDEGTLVASAIGGTYLRADLSSVEETQALAKQALAINGAVDILVNNAGYQHIDRIEDFPEGQWIEMQRVMLVAPFQLIKSFLPAMKDNAWGRIINMSSTQGVVASPFKSAYVAAKHGLVGLTKAIALEAGGDGVTVNAICPAYVRTPLVENQIQDQARTLNISRDEVVQKVMLEPAAVTRLIEPEEVAALAAYLVSDAAAAMTGAVFTIDGGWTAR